MPLSRPRRLFLALLALPVFFLFLLSLTSPATHRTISGFFSTNTHPSRLPDEIFGLLHFVTSPDEAGRVLSAVGDPARDAAGEVGLEVAVVPDKAVEMAWYALGSTARAREWEKRLEVLREEYPLVVFSKSYCPYSKRVKRLLETYDLSPPPKIVEVDLRADSPHIKTLLARLTPRSTFPNVILHGRSLGGSDDLMRLHEEDRLRGVLEAAGVRVRWTGEGGEGIFGLMH